MGSNPTSALLTNILEIMNCVEEFIYPHDLALHLVKKKSKKERKPKQHHFRKTPLLQYEGIDRLVL